MKKLTLKLFIFIILIVSSFVLTESVFAQNIPNYLKSDSIAGIIEGITSFGLTLITPIVVLVSLYSAFVILTAAGNPKKIQQGQQALMWTMIGLTVILVSHGLVQIVSSTASADNVETLIGTVIRYMRNIGGPIAIVMYLYGAFLYISGNPKKVESAIKIFTWTSVAVAIIMIATSIEGIVRYFIK